MMDEEEYEMITIVIQAEESYHLQENDNH